MTFAFAVMHIGGAGYFSPPRVLTNPGRRVSADISSTSSLTRGSMDCAAVRAVAAVSSIQHRLDTSTRANLSSAVYTAQTAINITKTVAKAAAA